MVPKLESKVSTFHETQTKEGDRIHDKKSVSKFLQIIPYPTSIGWIFILDMVVTLYEYTIMD